MPRDDGSFQAKRTRERRCAGHPTKTSIIARACSHVQHGGEPPTVSRAESPGKKVDAVDDLRRKGRIEPQHVEGLVDGHPVEQHQILRGLATADEELSAAVPARYDARQGRQVRSQVGRYVGRGAELNIVRSYTLVTGREARRTMLPVGPIEDLAEFSLVGFQAYGGGPDLVRRNLQRVTMRAIPDEGDLQQ